MKTETKEFRCFISAPAGTELTALLEALQEHEITVLDPARFAPGAVTLTEKVIDGIRHADLTVAILGTTSSSANVFFELGCASALGKKILVIAPEGTDIPGDLQGLLYIRSAPDNREALNFALKQILDAPHQGRSHESRLPDKSKPLGKLANNLLQRLTSFGIKPLERDIENVVQEMLETSGVSTRAQPSFSGFRPDFAVWVDELEPYFGNPLLVEVKSRVETVKQANELIERVLQYVALSNARTVLVFILETSPAATEVISRYPYLYFFSIREFLERLRDESFGSIVRDERNARVHGRIR